MNAKLKWVLILVVSLVMTAITLLFLQKYLSEETQRRIAEAEPDGIAVVVFARAVGADEQLSTAALALREFPEHLVGQHWLQQHQIAELLGQRLKYSVEAGEPLTRTMLRANQVSGLSRQLPSGFYAATLTATEASLHNGLLAVGDKVDVVFSEPLSGGNVRQHSFTDLKVFDLGQQRANEAYAIQNITLLVPKAQIAQFTRYQRDQYALWVRAADMSPGTAQWQPVVPASQVLDWTGGR